MLNLKLSAVKLRSFLHRAFPDEEKTPFASGIITAGGSGVRMGGIAKQTLDLCGKPCIYYSLIAFQKCPEIKEIIVVTRPDLEDEIRKICETYRINKLSSVVPGGSTRQESVANGFARVSDRSDLVAIHDAARPLIRSQHITKLLSVAKRYGAVCAAKRISDTVKRSVKDNLILETVPRDDLFSVQTPQVFRTDLYRISLAIAEKGGFSVTDDAALAEHVGFPVKLCDLLEPNFKLTTPEDVEMISAILKGRNND